MKTIYIVNELKETDKQGDTPVSINVRSFSIEKDNIHYDLKDEVFYSRRIIEQLIKLIEKETSPTKETSLLLQLLKDLDKGAKIE